MVGSPATVGAGLDVDCMQYTMRAAGEQEGVSMRRLEGAGRTLCLSAPAVTSARRWRRHGLARTIAAWVAIRWLYLAGVEPTRLARLYPVIR